MSSESAPTVETKETVPAAVSVDNDEDLKRLELLVAQIGKADTDKATEEAAANDVDARSIFVGSVDYATKDEELQEFFKACGDIKRVKILKDPNTGHPKGYAYIEFADASSAQSALYMDGQKLHNRELKVTLKRTNVPAFKRGVPSNRNNLRGAARRNPVMANPMVAAMATMMGAMMGAAPYGRGGRGGRGGFRGGRGGRGGI